MKECFISFFLSAFLFFQVFPQSLNSGLAELLSNSRSHGHENQNEKYSSAFAEIPVGNNVLFTKIYYFNTSEEGAEIAEEIYEIKNFARFEEVPFKKLRRIIPGDRISKYEFGMFESCGEFWILKNAGDGWIYGKGFYIDRAACGRK